MMSYRVRASTLLLLAAGCGNSLFDGDHFGHGTLRVVVTLAATARAGEPIDLTLSVQNAGGEVARQFVGTVDLSSSDGRATLPGPCLLGAQDHGARQFAGGVVFATAGAQVLHVSLRGGSESDVPIQVAAGPATKFVATGPSPSCAQGLPVAVTLTARDAYDNVATGYTGTVRVTHSDPAGTQPPAHTFTAADGGRYRAIVSFATLGAQSIVAADTADNALSATARLQVTNPTCQRVAEDGSVLADAAGAATDLALDGDGHPLLAFRDANGRPSVQRAEAGAWHTLGPNVAPSHTGRAPQVYVDAQGIPTVAWADREGMFGTLLVQRQAGAWQTLGPAPAGVAQNLEAPEAMQVDLALTPAGQPVVAWDSPNSRTVRVRAFDGAAWVALGNANNDVVASAALRPRVAVDSAGTVYVAWTSMGNSSGQQQIYLAAFDGGFKELDGSMSGGGISKTPASGDADRVALMVKGVGRPALAWQDYRNGNGYNIYYAEWDGAAWVALAGSMTGNGISGNASADATQPSLAPAADGSALVLYTQVAGSNTPIYMRRFDGSAWTPVGASASGGGVSAGLGGQATWPRLAVDAWGVPFVTWQSTNGGGTIYRVCAWR